MSWLKVKYSMPTPSNVQSCDMTIQWARESSSCKVVCDLANMVKYVKENNNQFFAVSYNFSYRFWHMIICWNFFKSYYTQVSYDPWDTISLNDIFLWFINEYLWSNSCTWFFDMSICWNFSFQPYECNDEVVYNFSYNVNNFLVLKVFILSYFSLWEHEMRRQKVHKTNANSYLNLWEGLLWSFEERNMYSSSLV